MTPAHFKGPPLFSYRHAFHAANHADVLKHTVLVAVLQHLIQKDAALTVLDTHAGAGLYRLDGDYAHASGEAAEGFLRLAQAPALAQYLRLALTFACIDGAVLIIYACAGAFGMARLSKNRSTRGLDRFSGVALLGMALVLAMWRREVA